MNPRLDMPDPGELIRTGQVLGRHVDEVRAARTQALTRAEQIQRRVDLAVMRIESAAAAARTAVHDQTLRRGYSDEMSERASRTAEVRLAEARRLQRHLRSAVDVMQRDSASHLRSVEATATTSMNVLRRFYDEVTGIRGAFSAALDRERRATQVPLSATPDSVVATAGPSGQLGVDTVQIDAIDMSDCPVQGPEDFTKVDFASVVAGLRRLVEEVMPRVERGATAEDFREMDRQREAAGRSAQYLSTYQHFYGVTAIKLVALGDGRYEVTNGYHRLWAARHLGITHLPVVLNE